MAKELLSKLKYQSTWRLLYFSFITLGVYLGYYIKRQTAVINAELEPEKEIDFMLTESIFIILYLNAVLFFAFFMVGPEHKAFIERTSNLGNFATNILIMVWGFKMKNRMNLALEAVRGSDTWFHTAWTFLFSPLYFNYKVNALNER